MIDKYTLPKDNDKSFAHSQNHIRRKVDSAELDFVKCQYVDKLQAIMDYWNRYNLKQIQLLLIGECGKLENKLSNYLFKDCTHKFVWVSWLVYNVR
jgi:hypothetical protein